MRRREFIKLVGGATIAWPHAARAQQAGKLPIIAYMPVPISSPWTAAFVERLRELGWIDGRTIAISIVLRKDVPTASLKLRPSSRSKRLISLWPMEALSPR